MHNVFTCDVEYLAGPHLMQFYAGLFLLEKQGRIKLNLIKTDRRDTLTPVVKMTLNNKHVVMYDAHDGLGWIKGSHEENLQHFKENIKADFYFKRSLDQQVLDNAPQGCTVLPLGLNYNIQPDANMLAYHDGFANKLRYLLKRNVLAKRLGKGFFYAKDFELKPEYIKHKKILFITRLWNPDEATSEVNRLQRQQINEMRVACIKACREKYQKQFTGGLIMDSYTAKHHPELGMPKSLINKKNYLKAVKEHVICIATTGLHNSIGWKLAEYVAASRAIVSEPLHYDVPGKFDENKNYYSFETVPQLLQKIDLLLNNKHLIVQMMLANYEYYQNYLQPDKLVLNTLNHVSKLTYAAKEKLAQV